MMYPISSVRDLLTLLLNGKTDERWKRSFLLRNWNDSVKWMTLQLMMTGPVSLYKTQINKKL